MKTYQKRVFYSGFLFYFSNLETLPGILFPLSKMSYLYLWEIPLQDKGEGSVSQNTFDLFIISAIFRYTKVHKSLIKFLNIYTVPNWFVMIYINEVALIQSNQSK